MIRKHFRLKKIALGLAFAAVVVPAAQAKVILPENPAPAYTPVASQPIASEISVQSPGSQLGGTAIKLTGAALVNAPAPVSQAVAHRSIASEISVQSPVSQLQVDVLRSKAMNAMARTYWSRPGITAAGAALANAKHSAYPVQVTQTQTAASDGFNWSDAGIGASVAFGATLLLLMAVVLGRRRPGSRPTGLAST
jgi:hypothetical protein